MPAFAFVCIGIGIGVVHKRWGQAGTWCLMLGALAILRRTSPSW
jgi:hypothetical protein